MKLNIIFRILYENYRNHGATLPKGNKKNMPITIGVVTYVLDIDDSTELLEIVDFAKAHSMN